ncbi:hypothetical protein B2O45_17235 [Salmonella enterica]|uniref:Phage protein n=1 Tax=Salmonella enterica TaxID=28901 RepID=A0A5U7RQ19_SALER|nr:hypothetical protein [Salmonella enterica]EDW0700795.1 hypothetical protein [Salmonella enterica subsp. enterica]EHW6437155.1 hypothetical protein [Salmonella enterica]HAF1586169.1 hypothetical protein [Salmonella enterica]HAF4640904.1 hypothetical protein [Salmonella enterica]
MNAPALEVRGALSRAQMRQIKSAIDRYDLTPAKRKRLLWRIAKNGVIGATKANAKKQHTPDDKSWPERAKGHGHKKMMRKLPGMLGVRQVDSDTVKVVFRGGKRTKAAVIAYAQQHGATIQMNCSQLKGNGKGQKNHSATKSQAKKLNTLGFKAPVMVTKGRKGKYTHRREYRAVAQKWITENLNMAQAGLIIRKLEDKAPVDSWTIHLPARPFLGITDDQLAASIARELQGIQYGSNIKKQDIKRK